MFIFFLFINFLFRKFFKGKGKNVDKDLCINMWLNMKILEIV